MFVEMYNFDSGGKWLDYSRYVEDRDKHLNSLNVQAREDFQGMRDELSALENELAQLEEKIRHGEDELKELEQMGSTNPLLVSALTAAKADMTKTKKRKTAAKGSITRKRRKLTELESAKFPDGGEYDDIAEQPVGPFTYGTFTPHYSLHLLSSAS
jgi:chromosome segregation ATPase